MVVVVDCSLIGSEFGIVGLYLFSRVLYRGNVVVVVVVVVVVEVDDEEEDVLEDDEGESKLNKKSIDNE